MSRDFDKAQEMVWASMEYVKVLGFRLRRTEVQRDDWKKVAQSHADELIKCRQQIDALKKERDGFFVQIQDMRAELDRLLAPCDPPTASHDTPEGKETAEKAVDPQPGDMVRLVRVPTVKDCSKYDFQDSEQLRLISTQVNTMGKVVGTELCEACACVVDDTGTIKAWPLSCVEVVKGGDK